jgi:2,5-furandicarboxylate decarboxylase 1
MSATTIRNVAAKNTAPSPNDGTLQPVTTLRGWLDYLAARDRLAIMHPGVALRFEVAAISKRLDGQKATFFPRLDGHAVPVVSNLVSDRGWLAEAMGVPPSQLLETFQQASLAPLPWHEVQSAPAQEVVHHNVDLARLLPLPTHNEHDSAPYITAGLVITRNPRTGVQNVSILRCQLSGPSRLGVCVLQRHTHFFYEMAAETGEPLPVAIVIGVDPLTLLASQAIVTIDRDELEIAGALHRRPLDVVKCKSSELRVPAEAEIVIEGRFLPGVREPEGPFGEFPQYYGERENRHVVEVDLVTHRKNPIYHTITGGGLEHLMLGAIPREATLLAHLQRTFPNVLDVHLSKGGMCRYHLYVKIKKRFEGEAKNIMMGAFAGHYDVKHVFVVDDDVDIHNPAEVEWAVATRSRADRDVLIVSGAQGSRLDPTTDKGVGAKMGIDATTPLDAPPMRYKRIRVPGEDEVDLARVVAAGGDWRRSVGA